MKKVRKGKELTVDFGDECFDNFNPFYCSKFCRTGCNTDKDPKVLASKLHNRYMETKINNDQLSKKRFSSQEIREDKIYIRVEGVTWVFEGNWESAFEEVAALVSGATIAPSGVKGQKEGTVTLGSRGCTEIGLGLKLGLQLIDSSLKGLSLVRFASGEKKWVARECEVILNLDSKDFQRLLV